MAETYPPGITSGYQQAGASLLTGDLPYGTVWALTRKRCDFCNKEAQVWEDNGHTICLDCACEAAAALTERGRLGEVQ